MTTDTINLSKIARDNLDKIQLDIWKPKLNQGTTWLRATSVINRVTCYRT